MNGAVSPEIQAALAELRRGGVVAIPTETVYGLAADAENASAVRRIFALKGRPADHPLIVHLAAASELPGWAAHVPAEALRLAERFWPGPLTLILKRSARVPDCVTGGLETVGLRVPSHPLALELLRAFGGGLAAPSANRFGRVSPTCAAHVRDEFGAELPLILDGGPCSIGVESTIVDLSGSAPAILRPGGITQAQLVEALGQPVPFRAAGAVRAPGTLPSHYAPRAAVILAAPAELTARAHTLAERGLRLAVLSPERPDGLPEQPGLLVHVPIPRNPEELARGLYALLRSLDEQRFDAAVVQLPPPAGMGEAVLDRLRRAAAPRD